MTMTRRDVLGTFAAAGAVAAGAAAIGVGCTPSQRKGAAKASAFYGPDGKLNEAVAKQACFDLMKRLKYPVYENLRKNLWVLDFSLGRFAEVGMGGIFWINDKEGKYLGHEIFLLPGQMIPEHWHVRSEEAAPKAEAWQLRFGGVTLFGEGDASSEFEKVVPPAEKPFTTVKHATVLAPGDVAPLNRVEARHFMVAGPQGCIVTEYASYHDMKALRFTNPNVKL